MVHTSGGTPSIQRTVLSAVEAKLIAGQMMRGSGPVWAIWRCWAQRLFLHPVRQRRTDRGGDRATAAGQSFHAEQLATEVSSLDPDPGGVHRRPTSCEREMCQWTTRNSTP